MASYNHVILIGNLTRDIETATVGSGNTVSKFGLAVNRKYKTKDGQQQEDVMFVDCVAWGRTGETMAQYLSKGRPVFIEGRLQLEQWEDKEGNKRSRHSIVVENFQFIDANGGQAQKQNLDGGKGNQAIDHDEIPFAMDPHGGFYT